ncbi:MAG: hypothetical protein PHW63_09660 [Alphaproteobacteria bacterium]|nr:hypothetical protein [Alphaproteobacteria bacterium]
MSYKFSDIITEGERRKSKRNVNPDPFEIDLGSEGTVEIEFPDANTYLALGQAGEENTLGQLRALFRKNPRGYNKVIDALEGAPVESIAVMIEKMWDFWDQDINQVPGKSKA